MDKRINQHRLVRSTVFNLALISLAGMLFFIVQATFTIRLFVVFLLLSIFFVSLALFTGRRSEETLNVELFHAYARCAMRWAVVAAPFTPSPEANGCVLTRSVAAA